MLFQEFFLRAGTYSEAKVNPHLMKVPACFLRLKFLKRYSKVLEQKRKNAIIEKTFSYLGVREIWEK